VRSFVGLTLTTSSENATVGLDYTFTCVTTQTVIVFSRDVTTLATTCDSCVSSQPELLVRVVNVKLLQDKQFICGLAC
jgi:hypothetical protein